MAVGTGGCVVLVGATVVTELAVVEVASVDGSSPEHPAATMATTATTVRLRVRTAPACLERIVRKRTVGSTGPP
jgi:hypothetical protein